MNFKDIPTHRDISGGYGLNRLNLYFGGWGKGAHLTNMFFFNFFNKSCICKPGYVSSTRLSKIQFYILIFLILRLGEMENSNTQIEQMNESKTKNIF